MENRNIPIANCIFTPTITTALFFIAILTFRAQFAGGTDIYLWAGFGSLLAAALGFGVGWGFRHSEQYNYCLRWLMGGLMILLIVLALILTIHDITLMME